MAILTSAPRNWYANLTHLHIRNLKSEISEVGRRELGRRVEHQRVPPGSVQPRGQRELSTLTKMAMP
jgi:hypothetical protein